MVTKISQSNTQDILPQRPGRSISWGGQMLPSSQFVSSPVPLTISGSAAEDGKKWPVLFSFASSIAVQETSIFTSRKRKDNPKSDAGVKSQYVARKECLVLSIRTANIIPWCYLVFQGPIPTALP